MSPEAKWNLGFLVLLVLISAPGVTLLMRKQMQPGARRLADPPYVRRTEAYNNPLPAASSSSRIVPPKTAEWVASVSKVHVGRPPLRHEAAGGRTEPIMSRGRRFELLSFEPHAEATRIVVLAWMGELGRQEVQELRAESEQLGQLQTVEALPIDVPSEVVEELKDEGYVIPPTRVAVILLRFAGPAGRSETLELHITWTGPTSEGTDVLDLAQVLPESGMADKEVTSPTALNQEQEPKP